MPPLPAVAGVLKCELAHQLGDAPVINILHWKYSGSQGTPADLNLIASNIATAWEDNVLNLLSNQLILRVVSLIDLTSDTAPVGEAVVLATGSGTGVVLSAGSAVVISHHISRRYRGGHPRTYLGGVVQGDLSTPQQLNSANVTAFNSGWADFVAAVVADSETHFTPLAPVSVSYRSSGAVRVTPVVDPILSSACQPRICSQRRRTGPLFVE